MMRSMYSGVSGLRTHQTKMDVIGNNIANVNTTAFKSQRVTFNEVFSQTLQSASSANDETGRGGLNPMQVGLGVNVSSIDMLMTQGAAQRTDNPFDLMIDGDGFMVVGDASGQYFTRAGALRKDDDGNLIIPNGMKVMGWQADAAGKEIIRSNVSPLRLDSPQNKTAPPAQTSKVELVGNLNIADAVDGKEIPVQIKMYDSLGNLYSMN
ncbi:MAG: flagellar hook-basal body complex protein, partial [Epulopiscium sp.]|nr:flagellar hook-basal body complex protein [Candidatus Epulonipiscium sp.]